MKNVELFTDGACSGNPGPGGWGVVLRYGNKEKELCVDLAVNLASMDGDFSLKERLLIEGYCSDAAYEYDFNKELPPLQEVIDKLVSESNVTERKKPTVYDFSKRERKANPTKGGIISELHKFLVEMSEFATESVEITNKERQIAFKIGEDAYELTLIAKRKPKS